jgi:uncharacterized protein (TIGR02996 family)
MNTAEAFLVDIIEHPDDDTPRLIYADWLADRGDTARADFIRVQIELARLAEDHPRRIALLQREGELLRQHRKKWLAELPKLRGMKWGNWERGFVGSATVVRGKTFHDHASQLFAAAPVRNLRFELLTPRTAARVFVTPDLSRLTGLFADYGNVGPEGAAALAGSPHLEGLAVLSLQQCGLGDDGAEALARSSYLRSLRALHLGGNGITVTGVRALARSPVLAGLTVLDLRWHRFSDAGAEALAESRHLAGLEQLDLSSCGIGDAGAFALAQSPFLSNLVVLDLDNNPIGDEGSVALTTACWPRLAQLYLGRAGGLD